MMEKALSLRAERSAAKQSQVSQNKDKSQIQNHKFQINSKFQKLNF